MKKFFIIFISIVFFMHLVSCGGYLGYNRGLDSREDSSRDETSYLSLTSHAEGVSVSSFEEMISGTCDDSYALTVTPGTSVSIISSSCTGTDLEIVAGFKATYGAAENRSITIRSIFHFLLQKNLAYLLQLPW